MTAPAYEPHTALLVVDVQNDFADPDGSLYVAGGEQLVDVVNAEIVRAVDAGSSVLYTQDWHPPDTPHFAKDGGVWPGHCVRGSPQGRYVIDRAGTPRSTSCPVYARADETTRSARRNPQASCWFIHSGRPIPQLYI